jgi:hypothetical protein
MAGGKGGRRHGLDPEMHREATTIGIHRVRVLALLGLFQALQHGLARNSSVLFGR